MPAATSYGIDSAGIQAFSYNSQNLTDLAWGLQKRHGASIVTRSTVAKVLRAADSFSPGARVASARVSVGLDTADRATVDTTRWVDPRDIVDCEPLGEVLAVTRSGVLDLHLYDRNGELLTTVSLIVRGRKSEIVDAPFTTIRVTR